MGNYIITIAREYGSGGRLVGQRLAQELGIAFYDKKLIALAAKESGFTEDFIEKMEQKKGVNFLYNLYMTGQELPVSEQVFLAQSRVIKQIAEKESCIILGRCADYVLQEQNNCLRIFIYAPMEQRIKRVREMYHEFKSDHELRDYIRKQDKNRAAYYNYYSENRWGKAQNYHLCINSSIGIPACVRVVKDLAVELTRGDAS